MFNKRGMILYIAIYCFDGIFCSYYILYKEIVYNGKWKNVGFYDYNYFKICI